MAHSTTSRLGCVGCPILFIVIIYKALRFRKKKSRMCPTFLLRVFSKFPNSSSNFGPSGYANRAHRVHRLLRPSTFCRNARAPVCAKLHTRMTVIAHLRNRTHFRFDSNPRRRRERTTHDRH
jgi:hypothetical protein